MKKIIALAMLAGSTFVSIAHASDGTINFTGTVTANACTVSAASASQSVVLGNVAASAFKAAGDVAGLAPFSVVLTACSPSASGAVIKFDGAANAGNSSILALTAGGGAATGVGVGIYDSTETTLIPLGTASASKTLSSSANTTFNFFAKYVATAATVGTGPANAVTNFTVTYQ